MRICPFFIIVLLSINIVSAQTTKELFSMEGLSVVGEYSTEFGGNIGQNCSFYNIGETVLAGRTFIEYDEFCNFGPGSYYIDVLGSKVYSYEYDGTELDSLLYMNFDLEEGDYFSIIPFFHYQDIGFTVSSKETIVTPDGISRRKLVLSHSWKDITWVEGVFETYRSFEDTAEDPGYRFVCASSNRGPIIEPSEEDIDFCGQSSCIPRLVRIQSIQDSSPYELKADLENVDSFEWIDANGDVSTDSILNVDLDTPGCYDVQLIGYSESCPDYPLVREQQVSYCVDSVWVDYMSDHYIDRIQMVDDNVGFGISPSDGRLYRTDDRVKSWVPVSDSITRFYSFEMKNELEGIAYVINTSNEVVHTQDGGVTWSPLLDLSVRSLGYSMDKSKIITATFDSLYVSNDKGVTWNTREIPSTFRVTDFDILEDDALMVWGVVSGIWTLGLSEDLGETWATTTFEDYDRWDISEAYFRNTQAGYIGGKGFILNTNDGGTSWDTIELDDQRVINDIKFVSLDEGWAVKTSSNVNNTGAVESRGPIYHTTDGGLTWEEEFCNTTYKVGEIIIVDEDLVMMPFGGDMWAAAHAFTGQLRYYAPDATLSCLSSVEELPDNNLQIKLFPNPTQYELNLTLNKTGIYVYEIYNQIGQTVMRNNFSSGSPINVASLEKGIYFINVYDQLGRPTVNKFIKL